MPEQSKIQNLKSKMGALVVVESREDADRCLQRIGHLERFIEDAENDAEADIERVRSGLLKQTAGHRDALDANVKALEAWATEYKAELFQEPRSLELNWGRVGFRWTPWKIGFGKLKVETIIEKLRAHRLAQLIRTTESVDRDRAVEYDAEILAKVGLKKTRRDEFFYEVKKEELR